jgi:DegV family protein with EDD domain
MKKVFIVTDSIANPPIEIIKQYGIQILPLNIFFDGRKYRDGIELSTAEAYRMLKEKPELFHSTPATVGEYLEIFKQVAGVSSGILCLTISSKLSTLYNIVRLAITQARQEGLTIPINVIDSRTAANAQGLIVTAVAKAAEAGKDLNEVTGIAEKIKDRVRLIGILDTVQYVYRTGRIPKITSKVGSLLNVRPCFSISEGTVHLDGFIKNRAAGVRHILKQLRKNIKDNPVHISIAHSNAAVAGEKLRDTIRSEFNCCEVWLNDLSPLIAYATGTGILIVSYYLDDSII